MTNGMTVKELIETLEEMPEDAIVMIKHDLIGSEQYAEKVELDDYGRVWIREINE